MVKIIIYSKKSCHLCDIAKEKLFKFQQEYRFSITEIDIEKDKAVFEKYKYLIPVIEIDGETVFNYEINEPELRKVLGVRCQPQ